MKIKSSFLTFSLILLLFLIIPYILKFSSKKKLNKNALYDVFKNILYNRTKIFCIILTSERYHQTRVVNIRNTYLKRCNNYIFASKKENKKQGIIKACDNDTYQATFCKFRNALKYAWKIYGDKYDWYYKLDDDSYPIMENVRAFLMNKNSNDYKYYGFKLRIPEEKKYIHFMSGGPGFILSKSSTKLLVDTLFDNSKFCSQYGMLPEDVEIGRCLMNYGINFSSNNDFYNRILFSVFDPMRMLSPTTRSKVLLGYWVMSNSTFYPNINIMGKFPLSFHYVRNETFYLLEHLIYKASVIGRRSSIDRMVDSNKRNTLGKIKNLYNLIKNFSSKIFI
uniref:N-acetylgalactosaminide beta-1,3-galactosyltransferase n=1 Tax=Parastrongyloides trichosuri TaxID=131310 RepID=A0A0N4ZR30_PARTI